MKNLIFSLALFLSLPLFASIEVELLTSKGPITLSLDEEKAPITVANFLQYVDSGFYNGTIFHRVVPKFVIQAGGHTADMTEKPTNAPIQNECENGLSNMTGAIGMARDEDMNSATAQFYINTNDNVRLDKRYAVFGKVTHGMEVVRAIEGSTTGNVGEFQNVPVEPIIILNARRVNPN